MLRAHIEADDQIKKDAETLFGPRRIGGSEDAYAGALAVGDAHLLLLPVRALAGILCYATSPFILRRYGQDLERAGLAPPALPAAPPSGQAKACPGSVNRVDGKLVLEDLDLGAQEDAALMPWAKRIATAIHGEDGDAQIKKKYGALAHKLPGMILQNGLAQATGFLLAKGKEEHRALMDDLTTVLRAVQATRAQDRDALHREVIDADLSRTLVLTRRALEACGWMKRYVQGTLGIGATGEENA